MPTDPDFRVLPHAPNYRQVEFTKDEKNNIKGLGGGWGCLTWGGIYLAAHVLFASLLWVALDDVSVVPPAVLAVVPITIASVGVGLLTFTIRRRRIAQLEREKNENARKAESNRVIDEASSLTSRVAYNHQNSTQLIIETFDHLADAEDWLEDAETEFAANAYSPFWDAVENAALHLSEFNDKTNQLSRNANDYYNSLNGRKHTFPPFPLQSTNLPDASLVVNDLRRVLRMGQTNFKFANIWEHRRTRAVLIAGFQTLGDAVNNLGSVIDDSISNLRQSVSSDMAQVVKEQIRTRESDEQRMIEQNRMLDNIQHHRKPGVMDTPQK